MSDDQLEARILGFLGAAGGATARPAGWLAERLGVGVGPLLVALGLLAAS